MKGLVFILACLAAFPLRGEPILFEKDIRPILKAHCFHCHGEDGKSEAGLDLRLARLIAKGGKSGPGLVAGKPSESLLFSKVDKGEMPKKKGKLPEEQIAVLREWIAQGAKTARAEPENPDAYVFTEEERNHWAFRPIHKAEAPPGEDNPIDAFILENLVQNGLSFSPEAEKRTLLRRATLDLTGLPPEPDETKRFLEDLSPLAYNRLIDRLLASPAYGERWGRHWLDVAGYADSEGYNEKDTERKWAWRYRDYVVNAFNDDMPWDQFIREQVSGDEMLEPPYENLKSEEIEKLVATGFLRMAPDGTGSGANDELARNQVIAETLKIVSSSFLGMSVGCAQCHDHRHDPITQRDYYSFRAIFEPGLNPKNWKQPAGRAISLFTDEDRKKFAEIEKKAKAVDLEREEKVKFFIDRTLQWKLEKLPQEVRDPLRVAYHAKEEDRTPDQVALLKKYPSVKQISAGSLYLYDREYNEEIRKLGKLRKQKLDESLAIAREKAEKAEDGGEKVKVTESSLAKHYPEGASELEAIDRKIEFFKGTLSKKSLDAIVNKAKDIRAKKPEEPFVRALTEPKGEPPVTRVFFRGNHDQPKNEVGPSGLSIISKEGSEIPHRNPSLSSTGRRSAFAQSLTDGRHPLTARVLVNRFWLHHFGRGIVDTPSDFGLLGDQPSHPKLLDWLASDFMENGWHLKRLHRMIMTSRAYKQSSRQNPTSMRKDPDNRLLSHMNIRRMEAEVIRDSILSLSGSLNRRLSGKPIPVMEDEVGKFVLGKENLDGERKPGKAIDLLGDQFRRSLYVQIRRSRMLSLFDAFDLPAMEPNCEKRSVSTVAPQALIFMNDNFLIDQSKAMAIRFRKLTNGNLVRLLELAWQHTFTQHPSEVEIKSAMEFVQRQKLLLKERKVEEPELLAIASYCQALLSSNRFLYFD